MLLLWQWTGEFETEVHVFIEDDGHSPEFFIVTDMTEIAYHVVIPEAESQSTKLDIWNKKGGLDAVQAQLREGNPVLRTDRAAVLTISKNRGSLESLQLY